jgi:tetratricopeptide (TPR) repeat protein
MKNLTSWMITVVACAAILSGGTAAWAADKWVTVRSPHFVLVGNASESRIRRMASDLEQCRAAFAMLLPTAGQQSTIGTTVLVFKDDASFTPFKPLYKGKPANVAGYFMPGQDQHFIALNGDIDTPTVIYHEFVHSLAAQATRRLPLWLNEGLAEFYSTFQASSNGMTVDLGRPVVTHVALLRQRTLMPLNALLAVDHNSPDYNEESKQGMFYAQSWALVHYLIVGNGGKRRPQLEQYLTLVAGGAAIDESFRSAFQIDYAGLERELIGYLRLFTMEYYKVTFAERIADDRVMRSSPISPGEVAAYRGDLLTHMGRADAAEKELATAIALDPALSAPYRSMGVLRLREKKDKEALDFFAKAAQGDAADARAHLLYAELLQRTSADDGPDERTRKLGIARAHLKQAIALSPSTVDAYPLLGYIALTLRSELRETEAALRKASALAPGHEELELVLADLMIGNDEDLVARVTLTHLRRVTTTDRTRDAIDSRLKYVQARIDAQARRDAEAGQRPAAIDNGSTAAGGRSAAGSPAAASTPIPETQPLSNGSPADTNAVRPTRRVAGSRLEGFLTEMECASGMTLHVRSDAGPVLFHTDTPSQLNFVSYTAKAPKELTCGPITPEQHVVIVYRPGTDPRMRGEPLSVEFVP